jgi:hypothetical protein
MITFANSPSACTDRSTSQVDALALLDRAEATLGTERQHLREVLRQMDSSLARTGTPVQEGNLRGQLQSYLKS